jgi:hypothetical protein
LENQDEDMVRNDEDMVRNDDSGDEIEKEAIHLPWLCLSYPDTFIAVMSGEQMSRDVQKFCNDIGTTLRALEEGTPWSNKAELYIGLL